MNILLMDEKEPVLEKMAKAVLAAVPAAQCFSFQNAEEALEFAKTTPVDIAFWDVNLTSMLNFMGSIIMTQTLSNTCPDCKVIYCIDKDKYVKDIPRIRQSVHLFKPVTPKKVLDVLEKVGYSLSE